MSTALIVLFAVAAIGLAYVLLPIGTYAYFRLRGPRLVTCPDTQAAAEVDIDAAGGAVTGLFGRPALRVKHCARWQDEQARSCAQGCLEGIDPLAAWEQALLARPLQATGSTVQQT